MAYTTALDTTDSKFGKDVWQALQQQNDFDWDGVFWLLDQEAEQWHLVVVTPLLDELGPRRAYTKLSELTKNIRTNGDQFLRVTLMSPKSSLYGSLRSVFAKAATVEGLRLGNTYVGNVFVPDAYLYDVH